MKKNIKRFGDFYIKIISMSYLVKYYLMKQII